MRLDRLEDGKAEIEHHFAVASVEELIDLIRLRPPKWITGASRWPCPWTLEEGEAHLSRNPICRLLNDKTGGEWPSF
jgi:hypothetical protein